MFQTMAPGANPQIILATGEHIPRQIDLRKLPLDLPFAVRWPQPVDARRRADPNIARGISADGSRHVARQPRAAVDRFKKTFFESKKSACIRRDPDIAVVIDKN